MAKFELENLPYKYNALEPFISEETLRVHHDKHHKAYTDKFNAALLDLKIESENFEEIFSKVSDKPTIRCGEISKEISSTNLSKNQITQIRNNGGGFWNHNFYFEALTDKKTQLSDELKKAIDESFGSFEKFVEEFSNKATTNFGSGWTWLAKDNNRKLVIYNTPNQDNYMMDVCSNNEKPILVIDIWEHAYYIDYQNLRPKYIENFFKIVNWDKVSSRFN